MSGILSLVQGRQIGDTERLIGGGRAATLFEELSNAYSEFVENAGKDQFFLSFQSHGRVVRGEDLGDLGFGIEDHYYQDAGIQVCRDFLDDLTPTIVRGANLEDEFPGADRRPVQHPGFIVFDTPRCCQNAPS